MEQVHELQDQELPLVGEQEPQALEPHQVQALLAQAEAQMVWLEARVRVLAGLLAQVQVEVQALAQAVPQAVGLEQALAQELVEGQDLQALPLLSLYQSLE
jgi:hypothetical protein